MINFDQLIMRNREIMAVLMFYRSIIQENTLQINRYQTYSLVAALNACTVNVCVCVLSYRRQSGNQKSGSPAAATTWFSAGWSGIQNTMSTWWQRIRRASPSQQPCPSGHPPSQMPSQVPSLRSLTLSWN